MAGVLDRLDAGAVRRWALDTLDRLRSHRDEIDGLNVFPVPDGDTGTNLYLTVESAVAAVEAVPDDDVRDVADALASGALHGARGSSGVILSQLLQGWADALREHPDGGAGAVRTALARAADSAYAAVSRPSEGTMLSVARAAADGASRGGSLREVVSGALVSARAALDRTPNQLDALGRAGVVDAGGRGLLLVLESLAGTVAGRRSPRRPVVGDVAGDVAGDAAGDAAGDVAGDAAGDAAEDRSADRSAAGAPGSDAAGEPAGEGGPSFEVMYLLELAEDAVPALRAELDRVGDSVVVVGGPAGGGRPTWKVHVHTGDVRAALDAGFHAGAAGAGRPRQVRVAPLAPSGAKPARPSVGVVAVAPGAGLAQLLATSGALVLVREQLRPPRAQDLLHAVRDACAEAVVLLPDGPDAADAAETAIASAREQGLCVEVVPTQAPAQALAALAVHDPGGPLPDVLGRMADAAAATRHGAVTLGSGGEQPADSATDPRRVLGPIDGYVDGCVVTSGDDPAAVARAVVDRLLGEGGELLTVLTGAAPEARTLAAGLCRHVRDTTSDVDVQVLDGGQDGALLLLGVE